MLIYKDRNVLLLPNRCIYILPYIQYSLKDDEQYDARHA